MVGSHFLAIVYIKLPMVWLPEQVNSYLYNSNNFIDIICLSLIKAFSDSLSLGISTALAVFFHEIPHELGDFAVLHTAGFKLYTILILNTIASACSLAAFFIVSVISSDEILREWIFTVVIGVFFYISLINLVSSYILIFIFKYFCSFFFLSF